ncbi:hypothetical protein [Streptomyces sp. NPDC006289]|uniref:AbiTii domain-containing protein n=1 Tax=Streptomyces sp. NPDC006289 TaxID=3156744 RepID=UPI0033B4A37D
MKASERAYTLELADELLTDIELSRLPLDKLLLKASRLARLTGDDPFSTWVKKEIYGYSKADVGTFSWKRTKRNVGDQENPVYAGASYIVTQVGPLEEEIRSFRFPDISGDKAVVALRETRGYLNSIRDVTTKHRHIITAVTNHLHEFVVKHYHLLRFSVQQDDMFESARQDINKVLDSMPGEALSKLDSAYTNISAGDPESIAGAMNSIRRLIDAVADAVFPATGVTRTDGQGSPIKLGNQNRLNRIKAYIDDHVDSKSHGDRLKRAIGDHYARVSTGVHNDVAATEASYLFLSTYVLLGEIISLRKQEMDK